MPSTLTTRPRLSVAQLKSFLKEKDVTHFPSAWKKADYIHKLIELLSSAQVAPSQVDSTQNVPLQLDAL